VPFGLPRRELPRWAIGLIVVLAVALFLLAGAWWRSSKSSASLARAEPEAPARTEIPLALPPATVATPPVAVFASPQGAAEAERAPESSARRSSPPPAATPLAEETRSAEPAAAIEEPAAADEPTLPSAGALAAQGIMVPDLRLELHAYSPRAAERFVFINGSKYVEGATLAEGPRLVTVTPNGAVLVYLGHRFLLAPQ
jgi:hypothetical protein